MIYRFTDKDPAVRQQKADAIPQPKSPLWMPEEIVVFTGADIPPEPVPEPKP